MSKSKLKAFLASKDIKGSSSSQFQASAVNGEDTITITVRGTVGDPWDENDHTSVAEMLEANPTKPVVLKVNSLGGSVFDGFGIANALMAHEAEVTAIIEGVAYSAASFLVLTADIVRAYKTSTYGVHRSWTATVGNQKDHQSTIDDLEVIDNLVIDMYVDKTGLDRGDVVALVDGNTDGTMLSATKALELGFVDEIIEPKKKKANDDGEENSSSKEFASARAERQRSQAARAKAKFTSRIEALVARHSA